MTPVEQRLMSHLDLGRKVLSNVPDTYYAGTTSAIREIERVYALREKNQRRKSTIDSIRSSETEEQAIIDHIKTVYSQLSPDQIRNIDVRGKKIVKNPLLLTTFLPPPEDAYSDLSAEEKANLRRLFNSHGGTQKIAAHTGVVIFMEGIHSIGDLDSISDNVDAGEYPNDSIPYDVLGVIIVEGQIDLMNLNADVSCLVPNLDNDGNLIGMSRYTMTTMQAVQLYRIYKSSTAFTAAIEPYLDNMQEGEMWPTFRNPTDPTDRDTDNV